MHLPPEDKIKFKPPPLNSRAKDLCYNKPIFHQNASLLALWYNPQCKHAFCVTDTNKLVSKNSCKVTDPTRASTFALGLLPCFAILCQRYAQRKPQRKHVMSGNICVGFALGISCFLSPFHLLWVPKANAVSGGIWAVATKWDKTKTYGFMGQKYILDYY